MRRFVFALVVFTCAAWVLIAGADRGQAQVGPDEGGAVLKTPFDVVPAKKASAPSSGSYVEGVFNQAPMGAPQASPVGEHKHPLLAEEKPDINQDIHVTSAQGPWMIMIESYTGPEAPVMARNMVTELRSAYQLPAFTFSYGAEQRRKEYERVKKIIDQQKEYLRQKELPLDYPIRVRYMRIEEQVAVVVGGYPSDDAARKALNDIRKLKPPDPGKVKLATMFYSKEDAKKQKVDQEAAYVNPFKRAFVVRNPSVKQDRPADREKLDINVLKKLNAGESYSLLNSKKPFTLAIKGFQTPTTIATRERKGNILEVLGFTKKNGDEIDGAAHDAHNLAESLRKIKLDAYVLHTTYSSLVTVGAFDSLEDPSLHSTANLIETRLRLDAVGLFPKPIPMQVPR